MVKQDLYNKSPVRLFDAATEGGLKEGGLGLVTSKKGLGKTSVLVQFGMDTLLKDKQLVHVTFDLHSSNVISWYDGIFAEIAKKSAGNSAELKTDVVSKRTILNFSLDNYSVTKVSEDDVKAVADYAQSEKVTVWTSATSEGAKLADVVPANLEKYFDVVVNLAQTGSNVAVDVLKLGDKKDVESGLKLDSKTLLISK